MDTNTIQILFQVGLALLSAVIAFNVYRLSQRTREDTWLRTLWDYQRSFWQDNRMEEVRTWIACDAAYDSEIKRILEKRHKGDSISKDEYKHIETIDRFAALLVGYKKIAPQTEYSKHKESLNRLFFDYWLKEARTDKRSDLRWYLDNFYPELFSDASSSQKKGSAQ